jgi:uncharacterized membrane protein
MAVSVLSLLGIFVALYLLLWKIGVLGELSCTTSGCETVQTSAYSDFLGVPVALYGVAGFASLFVVSLVGLQPRWLERREPTVLVAALSGVGVAFSAYLTYLEASVIHAWCQWCVASAVIIAVIFALSLLGLLTWQKSKTEA